MDIQDLIRRLIAQQQQKQPPRMGLMGMQPDIAQMLMGGVPQQALSMLGADMQIGPAKSWARK